MRITHKNNIYTHTQTHHYPYSADNAADMRNFQKLAYAEHGAEGSGCQGHVVHNMAKSVEDHEVFKDVKHCVRKINHGLYNTESYSELWEVKGTEVVGRPASCNSLEWQGEFTKA